MARERSMSNILKALFIVAGAAALLVVSVERGALPALLAWIAPAQEAGLALTQSYLFRLAARPFSKRFTQALILVTCGEATFGRLKSRYVVRAFHEVTRFWRSLSVGWRLAFAGSVFAAIALSEYGSYLAILMLPFASPILRGLHFWGLDLPFDHAVRPLRRKLRYVLRNNAILRALRWPYRSVVCMVLKRTETARQRHWWRPITHRRQEHGDAHSL